MHNRSKHTNRREARRPQLKSRSGKIRGATRVHANITIAIHSDAILSHMVVLSTLFDTYVALLASVCQLLRTMDMYMAPRTMTRWNTQ